MAVVIGIVATAQYANAPTSADAPLFHKGDAELALDMVHNSVMVYSALRSPRVIGCVARSFAEGGLSGGVTAVAQIAKAVAKTEAVAQVADAVDPSGNARKVVEIAAGISISGTRCFAPDTLVWMCDGSRRPIAEVMPGDSVLSRDPQTGETACRDVLRRSISDGQGVVEVRLEAADGTAEVVRAASEHPFWVPGRGWTPAGELAWGEEVSTEDGRPAHVTTTLSLVAASRVFNLEVEQFHTYFVGG